MNHNSKFSIAIHGGAGTILKSQMTPEKELAYRDALKLSMNAGYSVLAKGGSSLDAVEEAVRLLEDCELFNAGKGSVFNHQGKHEMDASLMDGATMNAGAVAGISGIKNPVTLARYVMEKTEHVFLSGQGAMDFALSQNFERIPDSYFYTDFRFNQLQEALQTDRILLDHSHDKDKKFGTVGAVAVDIHGNIAAATSTGGMTNKKYGRVGDTPMIGAGTYADNNTCGVSCTGHGEFFIKAVAAFSVSALMEFKKYSLKDAADHVIHRKLLPMGGEGGLIAVDSYGNICFSFNSEGMYRGYMSSDGSVFTGIYSDDSI